MRTITHAGHVFDLLVITQILDYWLQLIKPATLLQTFSS